MKYELRWELFLLDEEGSREYQRSASNRRSCRSYPIAGLVGGPQLSPVTGSASWVWLSTATFEFRIAPKGVDLAFPLMLEADPDPTLPLPLGLHGQVAPTSLQRRLPP